MINLIPTDARKQVKLEYWIRVVSVWMFLVATAFVMISILNVPVYVLVQKQLDVFNVEYESANEGNLMFKQSEIEIKDANNIGMLLQTQKDNFLFSEIISQIESIAKDSIVLSGYGLKREAGQVTGIIVTGVASSRSELANFRDDLENNEIFDSADLPLSNLAKDKNIPFNIAVVPADVNKDES